MAITHFPTSLWLTTRMLIWASSMPNTTSVLRHASFPWVFSADFDWKKYFNLKIPISLLQLPAGWKFLQVMDIFFKIHKVFCLDYNPSLKTMMHFIEYFLFSHKATYIKVTPKMTEVFNKIVAWCISVTRNASLRD